MVNVNALKGAIAEAGLSIAQAAAEIGLTPRTMYRKLESGIFSTSEVDDMIEAYNIRHPEEVFILGRRKK